MYYRDPFADVPQLDANQAHELWKSGEACVLDVREPEEWELGHIEGAQWIPLGELPRRWQELDPTRQWISVCRLGSRSNYAAALLRQAGLDVSNLDGGMVAWERSALPITPPGIVGDH